MPNTRCVGGADVYELRDRATREQTEDISQAASFLSGFQAWGSLSREMPVDCHGGMRY